ncbi:TetR/AcrR family transcriptional regulator [Devosia sp. 1566]|uniref:TetR/AcrR family transcriptional regulator n=1 Tax=Devosia sp. 1566 TaxID=2499144 RepID=UPI000FDCAA2A|nr:TetR/AcrR family transcriptional regulator [Devosia sp. 1566]
MGRHKQYDVNDALEAALGVFWQKGYEGTSFEDLTAATGVARPGLYAAFGNKQALFLQALDRYEAEYLSFITEALSEPSSFKVVERILRGSAEQQTRYEVHPGCLGVNGALACSDQSEPVRQELIRRRSANEAALCKRLERARAEGDLPASADCAALARFVMIVTQGMAVQAKAGVERSALDLVIDHVLTTWPTKA